jgi:hypothetical protein
VAEPLTEVSAILRDSMTKCIDTEQYLGDTRLIGDAFGNDEFWKIDTWISWFEQDPERLARYRRTVRSIDRALRDLADLAGERDGCPHAVDPRLADFLKLRVATAYFPSSDQVVKMATRGGAGYAARQMLSRIDAEEWVRVTSYPARKGVGT